MPICPHCGLWHDGRILKMCPPAKRDRWTNEEREQWREDFKRRNPGVRFAPSSAEMARRFGHLARTKGQSDAL